MSRTHERRSSLWLPVSLGGLLALAVLGVVVWRVAPRGGTAAPAPLEPVASLASVAPPTPSARSVNVTASAPGALYLGSALVGPLPASLRVESGTPARTYTIRAPGFASQDVLVGEASSAHIDVQLEKVEAPKIVPAASHAPPPPTAPTAKPTGGGIIVDPWK